MKTMWLQPAVLCVSMLSIAQPAMADAPECVACIPNFACLGQRMEAKLAFLSPVPKGKSVVVYPYSCEVDVDRRTGLVEGFVVRYTGSVTFGQVVREIDKGRRACRKDPETFAEYGLAMWRCETAGYAIQVADHGGQGDDDEGVTIVGIWLKRGQGGMPDAESSPDNGSANTSNREK